MWVHGAEEEVCPVWFDSRLACRRILIVYIVPHPGYQVHSVAVTAKVLEPQLEKHVELHIGLVDPGHVPLVQLALSVRGRDEAAQRELTRFHERGIVFNEVTGCIDMVPGVEISGFKVVAEDEPAVAEGARQ